MSWRYEQVSGKLFDPVGDLVGIGYAGGDQGQMPLAKNNPSMQDVPNAGPLPQGVYTIGPAYTHSKLGPVTMNLMPSLTNEMFGRGEFRIHGDNMLHPGDGSDGCIVMSRDVREMVDQSPDHQLEVVSGIPG